MQALTLNAWLVALRPGLCGENKESIRQELKLFSKIIFIDSAMNAAQRHPRSPHQGTNSAVLWACEAGLSRRACLCRAHPALLSLSMHPDCHCSQTQEPCALVWATSSFSSLVFLFFSWSSADLILQATQASLACSITGWI